nr:MAG TPA: hypothetical protein [Caudoviricetes sp.]
MLCIFRNSTPLKIFNMVILLVSIFMINNRIRIGIINKV